MPLNQSRPIHDAPLYLPSDASVAYEPGDMLYYDENTNEVKPASSMGDQGTEELNQEVFASMFVGICGSKKLSSNDTEDVIVQVIQNVEYQFPVDSSTFNYGDFLTPDEASGGTALEDQNLVTTQDRSKAIAVVTKQEASAVTKVWARPLINTAQGFRGGGLRSPSIGATWIAQTIAMNDAAVTLEKDPEGSNVFLYGNLLLVDPEGNIEILTLPAEADCNGELIIIKNTGGESITLNNDAAGTIATIATGEIAIIHCDGTTWTTMQFIETT